MPTLTASVHQFHAEAHVLSGDIRTPIKQKIEKHARVALKDERGGHLTRLVEDASIEGLVRFRAGHTRVSGGESEKAKQLPEEHGFVTLSTSVAEGLNIFEILIADRVVSQVATDHPLKKGHVPHVTFLGTKFENLKVCGFPVKFTLDLEVCGDRDPEDKPYLTNKKFLGRIQKQVEKVAGCGFLPQKMKQQYDDRCREIAGLLSKDPGGRKVTCSLVKEIVVEDEGQIPGLRTVENVLFVPHFGAVSFGEVEVGLEPNTESNEFRRPAPDSCNGHSPEEMSNYFEVTMLNMELGCVGDASLKGVQTRSNGQTTP